MTFESDLMSERDNEEVISSPVSQEIDREDIAEVERPEQIVVPVPIAIPIEEVESNNNSVNSREEDLSLGSSSSSSHSIDYFSDTQRSRRRRRRVTEELRERQEQRRTDDAESNEGGVEESKVEEEEEEEVPVDIFAWIDSGDDNVEEGNFERRSEGDDSASDVEDRAVPSSTYSSEGSTSDSSSDWNNSTSSEGTWTTDSSNSSEESYVKMGGEKDIPKYNGDRDRFEQWLVLWNSHAIRTKFSDINSNTRHPDCPALG